MQRFEANGTVGITAVDFHIPAGRLAMDAIRSATQLTPQQETMFDGVTSGLREVSVADCNDSADFAIKGGIKTLDSAGLEPEDIDLLVVCQSRAAPHLMSSEATRAHQGIGLKEQPCLMIGGLGCVNICMALNVARDHLHARRDAQHVLIIAGSAPYGSDRYREAVTVCGDAGMGVIVSRQVSRQIIDIRFKTDGRFWDLWTVDFRHTNEGEFREKLSSNRRQFEMAIATGVAFRALIAEICEANCIDKISGYISQNLSLTSHEMQERTLGLALARSCNSNCSQFGHLGDIDILLNLETSIRQGEFKSGNHVVLMNASPTACWSVVLIRV